MIASLLKKVLGSANERLIKSLSQQVTAINALEQSLVSLTDEALAARTIWFRERLAAGEKLDKLLPEAFATVREAAKRVLGQRHFDVQLLGGMVLHRGMIAEMKTGEGKTLVSTLAAYLNALPAQGVHIVTVNDYLARRDSAWMGQVYNFLGLSTGCIVHGIEDDARKKAYEADITYGTNSEFGFDYLRDNMKFRKEEMVQRPFHYAIVDEVDSILIDEARTPLIISGASDDSSDLYRAVDTLLPGLVEGDFEKDEKHRQVALTEIGQEHMEKILRESGLLAHGSLYDIHNVSLVHHVNQALRAHKLFSRDVDYIVKDDAVILIDEFTGRMMEGRRFSEGLHQALEAKERVTIQVENQTLATVTYQNYFRLYPKLSGMTGTAATEAAEFSEIYKLDVAEIPTNIGVARRDMDDEVYRTAQEKNQAICGLIEECRARQQPVLVGTVSIEKSEHLSDLLKAKKIPHQVLNARYHEQEAYIIAQAGRPGAVTIATNMAGRGTDIQLGGNVAMRIEQELGKITDQSVREQRIAQIRDETEKSKELVKAAGGLYVIGTERHESRRIDNQLRGRSGRQGDPGASKFFLSLDDDLMRIFGSERLDTMLQKVGLQQGEAITHRWINKALEKAQQKVEARNFEIRKNLLKFDDVMNDQRKVIYEQRREVMSGDDISDLVNEMRGDTIRNLVAQAAPENSYPEQWDTTQIHTEITRLFGMTLPLADWIKEDGMTHEVLLERITDLANRHMAGKAANFGPDVMRMAEKTLLLQLLDQAWKDHLLALDHLRQGIGLRAYAQRDPLNEYKKEAFDHFERMLDRLRDNFTATLGHIAIRESSEEELAEAQRKSAQAARFRARSAGGQRGGTSATGAIDPNTPRNAPCPCGSGKKFKQCHGNLR